MDTTLRNRPHLAVVGAVAAVGFAGVAALVALTRSPTADRPDTAVAQAPDASPLRGGPACASCGRVEAIRTVVVAGGADGAKRTVYRVTVRMDDGSYRTLSQAGPPAVAVGEAVRITDGAVVRRPSPDAKG
jgi:hypothetical protein